MKPIRARGLAPFALVLMVLAGLAVAVLGLFAPAGRTSHVATAIAVNQIAAAPAAATATTCNDGQPIAASLAPGSIGVAASSWPAGSTMAKIKARGYLIVGTSGDAELWGAQNPATGDPEGFDVDVAKAVAAALGLSASRTEYKVLTLAQRAPALQAGSVDLVAERMSINCDRWQGKTPSTGTAPAINLSAAYYSASAKLLVRKDSTAVTVKDLAGQPICGVASSSSLAAIQGPGVNTVQAPEAGQCLVKFQEGEAVAIVGDDTTLAGLAYQDQFAKVVGAGFGPSSYGLGIKASATDFTRFVNAVLEQLRSGGELTALYNTWMKPHVGGSAPAVPQPVYGRTIAQLSRQP